MSTFSAIADDMVRHHARVLVRTPVDDDDDAAPNVTGCMNCLGVIFPGQQCQRCYPMKQIGTGTRGTDDARSGEQVRQREARMAGAKTYESLEPCTKLLRRGVVCHSTERFTVGSRCVPCITAEYADDPTPALPPQSYDDQWHAKTSKPAKTPKPIKPPKPPREPKTPKYVPRPQHPIADANRIIAKEAKSNKYEAPDMPCRACGGMERYTIFGQCVACTATSTRVAKTRRRAVSPVTAI